MSYIAFYFGAQNVEKAYYHVEKTKSGVEKTRFHVEKPIYYVENAHHKVGMWNICLGSMEKTNFFNKGGQQ